jgi:hypothetical protein
MERIRKIIREALGIQQSIDDYTVYISKAILETVKFHYNKVKDGSTWELFAFTVSTPEIKSDTKIGAIKTAINYKFSNEFKINGNFNPKKIILLDDGSYEVIIEVKLETNNVEAKELFSQIKSAVSHELNHVFVHIKQFEYKQKKRIKDNKKSKADYLNKVIKLTKNELIPSLKENPALKEFVEMIYLSNPLEIQARVQQTAVELEYINLSANIKSASGTTEELLKFNPLRDARLMINYNLNGINQLKETNKEVLELFIKTFNKQINNFYKEDSEQLILNTPQNNNKLKTDIDSFFNYWLSHINYSGKNLAKKIFKLVADKHKIQEIDVHYQLDSQIYYRIFGEEFGHYF